MLDVDSGFFFCLACFDAGDGGLGLFGEGSDGGKPRKMGEFVLRVIACMA